MRSTTQTTKTDTKTHKNHKKKQKQPKKTPNITQPPKGKHKQQKHLLTGLFSSRLIFQDPIKAFQPAPQKLLESIRGRLVDSFVHLSAVHRRGAFCCVWVFFGLFSFQEMPVGRYFSMVFFAKRVGFFEGKGGCGVFLFVEFRQGWLVRTANRPGTLCPLC